MVKLSVCKFDYMRNGKYLALESSTQAWAEEEQTFHSRIKYFKLLFSLPVRKKSTEGLLLIFDSGALPSVSVVCLVQWNLLQFKVNLLSYMSNCSKVSVSFRLLLMAASVFGSSVVSIPAAQSREKCFDSHLFTHSILTNRLHGFLQSL